MTEFWYFECRKQPFSRCFGFLHFADCQILSDLGRSKSVLGSFFFVLDENWPKNMHNAAQTLHFQFNVSLISWTWMTLTLNMLTESLGWYFEVSQIPSMLFYRLIFIWCGCSAPQNQICQIVKHFDYDQICDVISDPEVAHASGILTLAQNRRARAIHVGKEKPNS